MEKQKLYDLEERREKGLGIGQKEKERGAWQNGSVYYTCMDGDYADSSPNDWRPKSAGRIRLSSRWDVIYEVF